MAIAPQGVYSRSAGLISAIGKQLRAVNFKPVSKITVQFDPFEERVEHARKFLHYISAPKLLSTNLFCTIKTNIVCDRSEPTVTCDLTTGGKVIFKLGCLDTLDALKLYNKHISSLVPEPEVDESLIPVKLKKKKKKLRIRVPPRRR